MIHLFNLKVKLIPVVNKILSFLFFGLSVSLMNAQESVQINSSFENGQKGFESNKGYFYDQNGNTNLKVRYIYQHEDLKVHVRNNGFSYESYRKSDSIVNIHRIDFNFINASRGTFEEKGVKHFRNIRVFYKNDEYYKSLCQKIIQKNVWEGVDIEYIINQETGDFKYNFIVSTPEALNKIGLSLNGQESAHIANGALILSTTNGEIKEVIPESFDANNHNIEVNWILENNNLHFAEQGKVEYPITIDPMPYRIWGRYIGGKYADAIRSIDVDTAGNVVFCGYTSSTGLATSGAYQTSMSSTVQTGVDAWVGKTTRSGYLIWASYFGGTRDDRFTRVAQTTDNNFVVVGNTFSTNFPKKNAFQTSQGGKLDAVIVKFSDSGSLLWSTYYGSSGTDDLVGIVSDPLGDIYASGYTTSSSGVTSGGSSVWKKSRANSTATDEEGWLVKINGSGSRQWSTFIGSYDGSDILTDVGYDKQNNRVLVGGFTNSNSKSGRDKLYHNFSGSGGTSYNGGVSDGFVASFGNNGSLNWARYYGDTGLDETVALVCDTGGVFYAVGNTGSGTNMASSGGFQTTYGGNTDGWLAKFNKNGIVEWSSYIGGTLSDLVWDLDMDTFNYLYLIGITESFWDDACGCVDTNAIYTSASYQEDVNGGYDAFIQKFNKSGERLWSTFYGGRGNEGGVTAPEDYMGIATGIQDDVFVGGFTASRSSGSLDSDTFPGRSNGADDGFLARFNQCDSFIRANWVEPTCHYDTIQFHSYDKDSNTVLNNMRYQWTGPSNFTSNVQNPFIPNADRNTHDGDYQLIAIDSTGCRDTVNLEVKLKYVVFFNNPDTITLCVGDSLTLGGIRAFDDELDFSFETTTYEWTGPDSFSSNFREPFVTSSSTKLNRGTYHLKATTVEGCWDTTFVFLNIGFADTIRAVDTACLYSSAKLRIDDISKYSSYKWKKPDGSTINDSIIDIAVVQHVDTGYYYIYLEKTNGCKDTIQTKLSLALETSSDFDITDASQCLSGNRFEFFYDSSANIGKVDSLFWLSTDSLSGYQKSSAIDSWSRSYSSAGAYNIRLISKSDKGCLDTTLKTINVRPTPSVDFTINSDSQCLNGNSFTVVNTSTISVGRLDSISWIFGDGKNLELGRLNSNLLPSFLNTTTKTYDSAGTYTIDFYAFSNFGCVDSLSTTIRIWPKNNTSITVAADSQCVDPNLYEFTNYDTLSSGSITNRRWTFGDNSFTNPALNVSNPTKSYSDSGAYIVTYITTTNKGCSDTANTQVYVYFNNHFSIDSTGILDVLCQTDSLGSIYSQVSGGNGSLSYKWYDSDTVLKSSMANLIGFKEGIYYLEITDSLNCVVSSALDTIISLSKISIENLTFIEPKCFNDSNAQITVDVTGGLGTLKYFWINNSDTLARTEDISNVWAETFVLVVEDDSLCRYSDTIDVSQPDSILVTSIDIKQVTCNSYNDAVITVNAVGGNYLYYSIDSGNTYQSSNRFDSLAPGDYYVMVKDTNGCTVRYGVAQSISTVESNTILRYDSLEITHVDCKSNSTGKAELSVKGGTKPYSYKWNRLSTSALVSTNEDLLNTIAGTYSLYVVDSFLCEVVIDTITITEPDKLEASLLSTLNVDCYGNSTAEAVAQVVGGTTPYVYSWLDNSGNQKSVRDSLQMIPKGTYSFFVTDSLNCTDSVKNVSITEPDSLYITNIAVDSVNCYDESDGSINVDIVGGTKNYNFEWTDNTGNVVNNQEDLLGVGIGNYRLSIIDKNSCVDTSAIIRINQPDSIRIYDITQVDVDCYSNQTGSIDVKIDGGVLPYSFQWKNSKASNISNSKNLTNAVKEKYYLIVTDYYSCQEQTALIEIDEPDRLVVSVDSFLNVDCKSNSTGKITTNIVGGNGGNEYVWINDLSDTITKQQNIYDVIAGTYHFYVTDSLGCIDSLKSKVITEPDTLNIKNIAITNVDCYNNNTGSVQVDVSGGTTAYSFQWTNSAGSIVQTNEDLSNVVLGRYALKVTDKQGCIDTIQDVVITQPDSLDIYNIVKENVDCYGNSTGDLFVDISGGTKAYKYEWIKVNNSSVVSTLEDLRNAPIGVYTLTVTDKNLCQKTFTDTITQPDLFKFDDFKIKGVTCYGDTTGAIYTTLIGGSSPFKHVWQKLNKDTIGNAKNLIDVPVGYYFTTVEDDSGCVITSNNIFVEAPGAPLSIWGLVTTDLTCYGDSNGTVDYSVYGGTPSYKYYWKLDTQIISTSKKLINAKAGSYTLIVEDDSLCTTSIPNVLIKEPGEVFIDTTLITNPSCEYSSDGSIQLLGKGGNRIYQYSIDSGKNYQSSQIFINLDTGVYYVQLTDSNQCISPIFKRTLSNGDKTKPIVRSNDLNIYLDSNGGAQIAFDSLDDMSFDNCEIDTMYSSVNEVDCGDMPLINGYLYAIDKNGNMDSSLFKLTIYDTIKPVFAVVDTVYVYLDSSGNGSFDNTDILISASDNCGIKDTIYSQNTYTCQDLGENIETTTISDIHMNSSSLSTIVIVSDTIAPVLDVEDIILYLDTNGETRCEFSSFDKGSYDECTIDSVGLDKMKFTCADTGNNLVNVWAIDPSGNESRKIVNARVLDSISPKFDIQSIVVTLDYTGRQSIGKGDLIYDVGDNCGIYDTTYSKYDFDLNDSGDLFIDVYVSDIHGNTTGPKQVKVTVLWGDADRDSIPDHIEGGSDFDGDGIPNYLDLDSDNDGILDVEENEGQKYLLDKDGDGKPNVWDLDSDGDGIDDVIEADGGDPDFDGIVGSGIPDVDKNGVPDLANGGYDPVDTDNDGDKDYKDLDTDDDGIPDEVEKGSTKDPIDTDSDGVRDWRSKDSDGDGISDDIEKGGLGKDKPSDSDNDGVPDYRDLDSDNDGITDNYEKGEDGDDPEDTDGDNIPDYLDVDSDNDGIPDVVEGDKGGDNPTDTDGDGIPDFRDLDSDDDGISDEYEKGKDGNNPDNSDDDLIPDYRDIDSDNDGLSDALEAGDDPDNPDDTDGDGIDDYKDEDSDNDGYSDGDEAGDDKENPLDSDGDGIYNFREKDSDDDEIPDSEEDNLEKTRIPDITIPEGISINNDGLNDILYIKGLRNFKNTSILIFNRWGQLVYESGLGYSNDNPFEGKYQGGSFTFKEGEYLPEGVYFLVFKSNDYRNLNIRQSLYIKK